jgi:hypothetical protein
MKAVTLCAFNVTTDTTLRMHRSEISGGTAEISSSYYPRKPWGKEGWNDVIRGGGTESRGYALRVCGKNEAKCIAYCSINLTGLWTPVLLEPEIINI